MQQPYAAYPVQPAAKKISGKTIGIIAGTAAALILAVVLFLVLRGGSSPMNTVNKFMKSYNDRDAKALLSCIAPESEQYASLASNFSQLENQIDRVKVEISKVISNEVAGNRAVIIVEVKIMEKDSDGKYGEPNTEETTFYLEKQSGGWKITDMN
jgi:uncharacterized protein YlxW (UPF0749 family)